MAKTAVLPFIWMWVVCCSGGDRRGCRRIAQRPAAESLNRINFWRNATWPACNRWYSTTLPRGNKLLCSRLALNGPLIRDTPTPSHNTWFGVDAALLLYKHQLKRKLLNKYRDKPSNMSQLSHLSTINLKENTNSFVLRMYDNMSGFSKNSNKHPQKKQRHMSSSSSCQMQIPVLWLTNW